MTNTVKEYRTTYDVADFRVAAKAHYGRKPVEITGLDVWNAVKHGVSLSFFIGIAIGLANALAGNDSLGGSYVAIIALTTMLGTLIWVPLSLGCRATAHSRSIGAEFLRLTASLVMGLYFCSIIFLMGMIVYVRVLQRA